MGCALVGRLLDEPLFATASTVRRWLLLEQPGAWGPDALTQSRLPPSLVSTLSSAGRAVGFRTLLIRRPDRAPATTRRCFAAVSGPGPTWMRELTITDPVELLGVDLAHLFTGGGHLQFGAAVEGPVHLVCTHGRHDPCCADFGRPLVRALAGSSALRERVWECSHLGGDRFAANLLCFPQGIYYGRVGPEEGERVVAGHARGTVDLEHYRGRSCYRFVAQAAEYFVRQHTGLTGIDELRPAPGMARLGEDEYVVEVAGPEGRVYRAQLKVSHALDPRLISCHEGGSSAPPQYELVDLR